jgi:tetratricopeptide (TPR) repeat protein
MKPISFPMRSILLTGLVCSLSLPAMADGPQVVFRNGQMVPLAAITIQGDNLVISGEAEGFTAGQAFPMASADHIYGERPAAVSQGIALMLGGKPDEAIKLIEPVLALHRPSSKIPGNFWVEAARAALIAYALDGKTSKAEAIGRDITEATPAQGVDPFVMLGKTLGLPPSTKPDERIAALKDLTTDEQPAAVAAYATFFMAKAYKDSNRNAEALETFLTVTGVYPTGGIILNAAAELNAADILSGLTRREEALALVNSASRNAPGTVLADEAKRRLDSLK